MHLPEIAYLIGTFLGGGILVRIYFWIKSRGKREESVDQNLSSLDNATDRLDESLSELEEKIAEVHNVSDETRRRQEALTTKMDTLKNGINEIGDDTKDNTRAMLELNAQVKELIKQLDRKKEKSAKELDEDN